MRRTILLFLLSTSLLLAQGNAMMQITNFPTWELCPRISLDGQRLAFVSVNPAPPGPTSIADINISTYDGINPMPGTAPAGASGPWINQHPAWFPNSAQVAYERKILPPENLHFEIWSVPLNAANGTRLVQNNFRWDFMPDISVNNDVAFVTSGNTQNPFPPSFRGAYRYANNPPPGPAIGPAIIAIKPAGQTSIINTVRGLYPRWNPTGTKIAYSAWNPTTGWDIIVADYRQNAGLINRRAVVADAGDQFAPAWSPDGKWIAYVHAAKQNAGADIFIVNIFDGTKIQETMLGTKKAGMPDWKKTAAGEELIYFHSDMNTPRGRKPNFNIYCLTPLISTTNPNFNIYCLTPLISTTNPKSPSFPSSPPAPGGELIKVQQAEKTGEKITGTKVRVLNVSADKNAEEANGFARKVANLVKKIDSDIVIVDVANGVDSGIPQVYYNGKKNKELASEIAQYLDGAVEDGTLGVDIPYMFSPAAPLPGGYAKDVDIVIEAPANFEAAEEEETTETAPSDENTQ